MTTRLKDPARVPGWRWSIEIDTRCTACGQCLSTCPQHALIRAPRRPVVVAGRCTGCLECLEICPVDAITEVHR